MAEPRYLLDTNICIYILADSGPAVRRLANELEGSVVTSSIAFAEIELGLRNADASARAAADALFAAVGVLPFDQAAARAYAALPFRRGRFDRLIAAHALSAGLTLVTNNEADFADVPGLQIENWTK
ncbi:type II toxin-antitoxin system VapC family toxin [Sphingomonas sp. IC-56]|uniref:type II toxin-antitoxin system VapC family toxin n=1 Tax=Sphingomonas sp. IC-56 TaxID=2898529 RepID=UPI001E4BD8A6|nr:type II toxin-antitoxin system VapC family toxin [Sphingomonas sp. IC-56]